MFAEWKEIWERDSGRCEYPSCGTYFNVEHDHIVPLLSGGQNVKENVHLLCRATPGGSPYVC